jgi:hypothetical protein
MIGGVNRDGSIITELQIKSNLQQSGSLVSTARANVVFESTVDDMSTGYIYAPTQKKIYNTDELKKALDIEVTELLPDDQSQELDLVPRPLYEDAVNALIIAEATIEDQSYEIANLEATASFLQSKINVLEVQVDSEALLRIISEANADNIRQQLVLINDNAQTALQRSVLEGISRSALEARNSGLATQVQALKSEVLDWKILAQQAQIRQAAAQAADGFPGTYEQGEYGGWKIPQSEISNPNSQLLIGVWNDDDVRYIQGTALNLYNFSEEVEQTFTFSVKGNKASNWIDVPASITIPKRVGVSPGRGYITLKWKAYKLQAYGKDSMPKGTTFEGVITVQSSLGETFNISCDYYREVSRADTWGSKGSVGTRVGVEKP